MITKVPYVFLAILVLIAFRAKADDYAWGATTGSSLVLLDATTGQLQALTYGGKSYTNFPLLSPTSHVNLGASLWVAQNSNGTLYGLDNSGNLYTINTTLGVDQNGNPGLFATQVGSLGVNVTGAVWISSNLLDISTNQSLYQYNLTLKQVNNLGSFNNVGISGLAFNGSLFGVQYSPSPGAIDVISGVSLSKAPNSSITGLSQGSSSFAGTSLLYVSDGNSGFYSYSTVTTTLAVIPNNFPSGIHSLTSTSASGGGGTPTPTPTSTPSPTPTATPVAIVYAVPTSASNLAVAAPETTSPQQNPTNCGALLSYTVTATASFAAGAIIDPKGTLEIDKTYQTTTNGQTYTPAVLAAPPSIVVSPWTGSAALAPIMSCTAGQLDVAGATVYYGAEIFQLVYKSPGNNASYPLGTTKTVYVYPWNTGSAFGPSAAFTNALTSASAGGNPSPYATPYPSPSPTLQEPPRFTVSMSNLYPLGTSAVSIYPGTPSSNPTATGSQVIQLTTATAPSGGLWTAPPTITFETAPYVNNSATTYTIVATQQLPANNQLNSAPPLLNPAVLNTVSFTISGYTVNGTVGTVK